MKQESLQYLEQFEEVFETAHRSKYVRNIKIGKLKRLISIYEEINGAKSNFNPYNMGCCLLNLILELRTEYRAAKDKGGETDTGKTKAIKTAKKGKEKHVELTPEEDGKDRQTKEV